VIQQHFVGREVHRGGQWSSRRVQRKAPPHRVGPRPNHRSPRIRAPGRGLVCERCGLRPTEDVDHVEPTFETIVHSALTLMSQEQKDEVMKSLNWDEESEFLLPDNHVVVRRVLKAHETAKLQAVCKVCHQENERERKG
jgi:hypothetical protein